MNLNMLDNPIWYALNSHHRHLAIRGDFSVRYQSDVAIAAALPESNASGFADLSNLVAIDETIALVGEFLPEALSGWQLLQVSHVPQLVCEELNASPPVDALELTVEDVPEMLALVALTQPGPFLLRTIEMGRYLGLRQEGKLVAMAGQRLHLTGFCEISAVCTHPNYRGRGYGGALTSTLVKSILARQEIPFLHVLPTNENAIRLYKKLGFRQRKKIPLTFLKKVAP